MRSVDRNSGGDTTHKYPSRRGYWSLGAEADGLSFQGDSHLHLLAINLPWSRGAKKDTSPIKKRVRDEDAKSSLSL